MEWWKGAIVAMVLMSAGTLVLEIAQGVIRPPRPLVKDYPPQPPTNGRITRQDTSFVVRYDPATVIVRRVLPPEELVITNRTTDTLTLLAVITNWETNYTTLYVAYTNLATNYVTVWTELTNWVSAAPVLLGQDWEAVRFRLYRNDYELPLDSPRWLLGLSYTPFVTNTLALQATVGYRIWQGFGVLGTLAPDRVSIGGFWMFE